MLTTLALMIMILAIAILKLLFMLYLCLGVIDISNARHVKRDSTELIPVTWHSLRWWDWCMSEDEKNK